MMLMNVSHWHDDEDADDVADADDDDEEDDNSDGDDYEGDDDIITSLHSPVVEYTIMMMP